MSKITIELSAIELEQVRQGLTQRKAAMTHYQMDASTKEEYDCAQEALDAIKSVRDQLNNAVTVTWL